MWVLFFVLPGSSSCCCATQFRRRAVAVDPSGYMDGPIRYGVDRHRVLGRRRASRRRRHRAAARLSRPQLRALVQLRPPAAAAHLGGHLRLRRQRADRHHLLRRPAHLPRAAVRRQPRLVRVLGLPALHRAGRDRLPARHHPEPRICRARMVCRSLADHRLGRLSRRLPRHAPEAQGAAHLRRELVLPRLHRHDRDAARRQQPGGAGVVPRLEELLGFLRRPGRADAVVVRPQRGRLLPDRRLPRHDVLLRAQAGRTARSIPTGCRSSTSGR